MANEPDELFLIDGNSLAYRAFFALPESIATSTGFPTNAIFGFASMLVKILTEHGPRPTVVVWDAPGMSGRKEVYPEYKAQRTSRPDLLREQWPHLEPLVDAFGYRNVRVDGYEADDVIASIAERAREQGVPVTIVTGDRDAFQLIDPESRVRVMATSRGITDTKIYDHAAVIERYGIPPELIPDFYGLKGDTSDNIPGVPGIGDKTASQLLQRFGDARGGPRARRRHLGRQAQGEPARPRRGRADLEGPGHDPARRPGRRRPAPRGRPRARPLAAARGLPRVRAARPAAAPGGGARVGRGGRARPRVRDDGRRARPRGDAAGRRRRSTRATAGSRCAVRAPEVPEGELLAHEEGWRFAVAAGDGRASTGAAARPEDVVAALGDRPVVAHDAKELGVVPARLAHDTMLAAYLLEPARRGFPFREITRGARAGHRRRGPDRRRRDPRRRPGRLAARAARASAA